MERKARNAKLSDAHQGATEGPRVSYVSRKDPTPEGELTALAAVYRFVLECHERKKCTGAQSEGEDVSERNCTGEIVSEGRR